MYYIVLATPDQLPLPGHLGLVLPAHLTVRLAAHGHAGEEPLQTPRGVCVHAGLWHGGLSLGLWTGQPSH